MSEPPVVHGDLVGGCYTVRDVIAQVEDGVVVEAKDTLLDRLVAIKFGSPEAQPLMFDARRVAQVRDPCAAAILNMGHHRGVEYVVGERLQGTLLKDMLDARLPADEYMAKLRGVTAAVARAHAAGITLGDVSGHTVLVGPDGRLVLGRLSLSQVPSLGPARQILAPEVIRGEAHGMNPAAAARIDLYALGCVAIELARGVPPFALDDDRDA